MTCEYEVFTQEAGIVCSKALEIIQLKKELKENSSYRNGELEQQLKEASDDIRELKRLLDKIAGMCGTPSAADGCRNILELYKEYLTKYKVKE